MLEAAWQKRSRNPARAWQPFGPLGRSRVTSMSRSILLIQFEKIRNDRRLRVVLSSRFAAPRRFALGGVQEIPHGAGRLGQAVDKRITRPAAPRPPNRRIGADKDL